MGLGSQFEKWNNRAVRAIIGFPMSTAPAPAPPTGPAKPSATPPTAPAPSPSDRRLDASIDHWKRSLLDLTRRNRALNFKPTRVSTIVIVDEQPAEVFRQLCLSGGSLKFKPAPEIPADSAPQNADG